jgi:hypothetical protein
MEGVQMHKKKKMKKSLPSLAIKEMQIKTILRFKIAAITNNSKCWQRWGG